MIRFPSRARSVSLQTRPTRGCRSAISAPRAPWPGGTLTNRSGASRTRSAFKLRDQPEAASSSCRRSTPARTRPPPKAASPSTRQSNGTHSSSNTIRRRTTTSDRGRPARPLRRGQPAGRRQVRSRLFRRPELHRPTVGGLSAGLPQAGGGEGAVPSGRTEVLTFVFRAEWGQFCPERDNWRRRPLLKSREEIGEGFCSLSSLRGRRGSGGGGILISSHRLTGCGLEVVLETVEDGGPAFALRVGGFAI